MLVLTRKSQESVMVGGVDGAAPTLTVTVLEISGGRVRLGFAGDPDMPVYRSEVWERMRADGELDNSTRGPPAPVG